MTTVASIVEGHGEVSALPVLVRRLAAEMGVYDLTLPRPHRVPRRRMTDPSEIGRAYRLQSARVSAGGAVLVLADGDDDCVVDLARLIRAACGDDTADALVVVAVREFESIFLAGQESLLASGHLTALSPLASSPEEVRGAKERIAAVIDAPSYRETTHQVRLAAAVSLEQARRCGWFRKLERDLRRVLLGA